MILDYPERLHRLVAACHGPSAPPALGTGQQPPLALLTFPPMRDAARMDAAMSRLTAGAKEEAAAAPAAVPALPATPTAAAPADGASRPNAITRLLRRISIGDAADAAEAMPRDQAGARGELPKVERLAFSPAGRAGKKGGRWVLKAPGGGTDAAADARAAAAATMPENEDMRMLGGGQELALAAAGGR